MAVWTTRHAGRCPFCPQGSPGVGRHGDSLMRMASGTESPTTSPVPRAGGVERPREDERILKQTGADMQSGWLARHGTLFLTDERLVFVPTALDTVLLGKRREIPLEALTAIERFPREVGDVPRTGRRPRIRFHMGATVWEFLVGDMDAWIDLLELVFARRQRDGAGPGPEVLRDGHLNVLLEGV
jgi:hypothetical protein